jgi:muramoyltetrapeptide carboxypeptidase LdcA involved in peptidoglycan recycling
MLFEEKFRLGVRRLEELGFRVRVGPCARKSQGYRSASIRERADELNEFFRDPDVRCIISAIGGWNSNSLLPYLDYEAVQRDPKIVVGYSDVTAILLGLSAKTGLATFYGPAVVPSFGEFPRPLEFTVSEFRNILCEGRVGALPRPAEWTEERTLDWRTEAWKSRPRRLNANQPWRCVRPGAALGPLIGGNLNTMQGFIGTAFFPAVDGAVFFVEDSLQGLSSVERSLAMLRLHGVFDRIGGLVVGKPELLDREGAPFDLDELLLEVTAGYDFPILAGVDLGHTAPMTTLPIGVSCRLDADDGSIELLEPGVKVEVSGP